MSERKIALFFVLAVALQVLILAAIPARRMWVLATGRTIRMEIVPVDPYHVISGYYARLAYEAGEPSSFPGAPSLKAGDTVYAVLEEGGDGLWKPAELLREPPAGLPPNRIALQGKAAGPDPATEIRYGIEAFFVPETQRYEVDNGLRRRTDEPGSEPNTAEVKVDRSGRAAIVSIRVAGRDFK